MIVKTQYDAAAQTPKDGEACSQQEGYNTNKYFKQIMLKDSRGRLEELASDEAAAEGRKCLLKREQREPARPENRV